VNLLKANAQIFGPPNKQSILSYIGKHKVQFILASLGGIFYNIVAVTAPIFLGKLLDAALAVEKGGKVSVLLMSAVFYVFITAFFQLARYVKRRYMYQLFNFIACDLRTAIITRLTEGSFSRLAKEKTGDLVSRTIGDVNVLCDNSRSIVTEVYDTWLLMISYFIAMLTMNVGITLYVSIPVVLTILLAESLRNKLYEYSMAARKAASRAGVSLLSNIQGLLFLRLYGREGAERQRVEKSFSEQAYFTVRETLLQQALLPVYTLVAGIGVVLVIGIGGQDVINGAFTIGDFNAYLSMFLLFSNRTQSAANVFNKINSSKAAWNRITEKVNYPGDNMDTIQEPVGAAEPLLSVKDLCFSYTGNGEDHISDISFDLKEGEILAVTGAVGSGKSALANAVSGLFPYKGSIKLRGQELNRMAPAFRTKLIAFSGQEQFLFSNTIKENIAFSDEIKEDRLDQSINASALHNDLLRFEKGLNTQVGEKGVMVSGGQRQRISLARAIYSDAKLLILDDPFSAVDISTEAVISRNLRKLAESRAVVIITHRLDAVKTADRILVLDKGRIAEQGTHESLIALNGIYSKIWSAQAFLTENEVSAWNDKATASY
jgi:ATP-binding cassette subfamily B multidrug efflux pump